jgi:hypothetical protein
MQPNGIRSDAYNGGNPGANSYSPAGIRYADGIVSVSATDASSQGYGSPWGIDRSWSNMHDESGSGENGQPVSLLGIGGPVLGNNWVLAETPHFQYNFKGNYIVVNSANDIRPFHHNSGDNSYATLVDSPDTFQPYFVDEDDNGFIYTDAVGDEAKMPWSDPDGAGAPGQQLSIFTDASGQQTFSKLIDGSVAEQYRDTTVGGHTIRDDFVKTNITGLGEPIESMNE